MSDSECPLCGGPAIPNDETCERCDEMLEAVDLGGWYPKRQPRVSILFDPSKMFLPRQRVVRALYTLMIGDERTVCAHQVCYVEMDSFGVISHARGCTQVFSPRDGSVVEEDCGPFHDAKGTRWLERRMPIRIVMNTLERIAQIFD